MECSTERKNNMLNWLKRSLGGLLALCMLISLVPTALAAERSELEDHWASAVSYTHLTLPTTSRV